MEATIKKKMLANEVNRRKAERECIDYIHNHCKRLDWEQAKGFLQESQGYEDLFSKYLIAFTAQFEPIRNNKPIIKLTKEERAEILGEMRESMTKGFFEKAFNLNFIND